jgi:taurine dioxygenase
VATIKIEPLQADLPFGVRVVGITEASLQDEDLRRQLNEVFEDRGLIVFEDLEPSSPLQVALSEVFGPLKDHPIPGVPRAIEDLAPGVIQVETGPGYSGIVEIGGRQYASWLPWHFDHCYNNELNRAGVLRCIKAAPDGGLTGFADGVDLYRRLSPDLRDQIETCSVLYTMNMALDLMRFGLPEGFREVVQHPGLKATLEHAKSAPRAVHPAVWTRSGGEKVLHISPWMAVGIEGREDPEGDALLEAVCQDLIAKIRPYHHKWRPTDMLVWDNWRMLHSVTGHDPSLTRMIHRTTIKGDYGLGRFENGEQGRYAVLERTV